MLEAESKISLTALPLSCSLLRGSSETVLGTQTMRVRVSGIESHLCYS